MIKRLLLIALAVTLATPTLAGAPVSLVDPTNTAVGTAANPLVVTGGTGGGGGGGNAATTSNATDGQATSTTNQQNVVYNYLFNGTTWDRVRGSGGSMSTFLSAPLPSGSNLIGKVGIDQTTPGVTNAVADFGTDGTTQRQFLTTTTGALEPVTAASSAKITTTVTALSANTSTTILAATAGAIAEEIQCDGTAIVAVDRLGGTLTSATGAGASAPIILPAGSYPLYTIPVATRTAITAYTGTAQTCRVTAYLR